MAFQSQGFFVTFTIQDAQGDKTHRRLELDAATMTDALAYALVAKGYLDAVTAGCIVKYTVSQDFEEDAATLPANTDISQGANIVMRIDGRPSKSASWNIPAPDPTIFVGTSGENANTVDGTDAAVIAFVGMFDADGGECFISDGEHIDAVNPFIGGYRTPRLGSRKLV